MRKDASSMWPPAPSARRQLQPANGRGYLLSDLERLRSFGAASAYGSIVIFSRYIKGRDMTALYHSPNRMWLMTPLLILWVKPGLAARFARLDG